MKRVLSLLLVIALLFALGIPALAKEAGLSNFKKQVEYTGFSDVPGSAWYADSVKTVCEYGLMNGKADAKFSPSGNMTIAEAVAIGCRLHDIYVGGSGKFEPSSPWYKAYVDYWLAFAEFPYYFRGKDASFWSSEITREIFAFVMDEALPEEAYKNINNIAPGILPDIDLCSDHWGSIYTLYNAGILTGTNDSGYDGVYFPERPISRAEVSAILSRIIIPEFRQKDVLDLPTINLFAVFRDEEGRPVASMDYDTEICACVSESAQHGAVTWMSLTPDIATVEADPAPGDLPNFKMAVIHGVSPGTAIIQAKNCLGDQMTFSIVVQPGKYQSTSSLEDTQPDSTQQTANSATLQTNCNYIINTNTGKFHYTWCSSVKKISEKNKWNYTGTRDSVIKMGYEPCKKCNP